MTWDDTTKALLAINAQIVLLPERKKMTDAQARHLRGLAACAIELHYIRITLLIEMRKQGKIR